MSETFVPELFLFGSTTALALFLGETKLAQLDVDVVAAPGVLAIRVLIARNDQGIQ